MERSMATRVALFCLAVTLAWGAWLVVDDLTSSADPGWAAFCRGLDQLESGDVPAGASPGDVHAALLAEFNELVANSPESVSGELAIVRDHWAADPDAGAAAENPERAFAAYPAEVLRAVHSVDEHREEFCG